MPLNSVLEIPGLYPSSFIGTKSYLLIAKSGPVKNDFLKNDVYPIMFHAFEPYVLMNSKKPVQTFEDMAGFKIRSTGAIGKFVLKRLNAVPVSFAAPELYEAIQRGVVDGTFTPWGSAASYKWNEIMKYATSGASFGSLAGAGVINKEKFDSLPVNIKKAVLEAGDEASINLAKVVDRNAKTIREEFEVDGVKIVYLNPAEQEKWLEKLKPAGDEWVSKMEKKNLPGRQVLEEMKKLVKSVEAESSK